MTQLNRIIPTLYTAVSPDSNVETIILDKRKPILIKIFSKTIFVALLLMLLIITLSLNILKLKRPWRLRKSEFLNTNIILIMDAAIVPITVAIASPVTPILGNPK